jgi:hypothetical protein
MVNVLPLPNSLCTCSCPGVPEQLLLRSQAPILSHPCGESDRYSLDRSDQKSAFAQKVQCQYLYLESESEPDDRCDLRQLLPDPQQGCIG